MRLWRITQAQFANSALSGDGSFAFPGRWHRRGSRVVYTADSLALAALEQLVHLRDNLEAVSYFAFRIEVPDDVRFAEVLAASLPDAWDHPAAPHEQLRDQGQAWLREGETVALLVPSAVIPDERNVLLNPAHPDFGRLVISVPRPFRFDPRLLFPPNP